MKLDFIVTLANRNAEVTFRAMERSLRETGCELPIKVIPYNDDTFDLPEGSEWWEDKEFIQWSDTNCKHPMMRKYQCLTSANYQFVDTDVIFLRNPEAALGEHEGFIASCGHWHDQEHTFTPQSRAILKAMSTTWQKTVFNAGQFACDRALYSMNTLRATAEAPANRETCIESRLSDQPGLNLLVHLAKVPMTNLTLPPHNMESTWAGDYSTDYSDYWNNESRQPYLIHWAGKKMNGDNPIDELAFQYLTETEKNELLSSQSAPKPQTVLKQRIKLAIHALLGHESP